MLKIPDYKNMSIKADILTYDKPKYVYIPLINHCNIKCKPMVKEGDYVYTGDVVGKRDDDIKLPIHSSISGKVTGIEEKYHMSGELVKCVVIKNDFKNKINENKIVIDLSSYSKSQFINILKSCGIIGMGGGCFPTYKKYDHNKKINTLLINGVECEPFITADYSLMVSKTEQICEAVNSILKIMKIDSGIIVIRKNQPELKQIFMDQIEGYSRIKLKEVSDTYPMGWERKLIKKLLHKKYNKIPLEKGIVVNNISTIFSIYEALKYNKPVTEKMVTITGNMIKKPQNIIVKIGTPIKDIIKYIGGYKVGKTIKFIAGGPMMGTALPNDELVMSNSLNCVLAIKDNTDGIEDICIKCGKCNQVCPSGLNPSMIKENIDSKDLKDFHPEKCMECGLCSYICPAKIELVEDMKQAKEIIK